MYSCAAASLAAFLCPQDFLFVLILRGALKEFVQLYKLLDSADRKADGHDLHVDLVLRKSSTVPVRQQP